jgi:hypothetical protein
MMQITTSMTAAARLSAMNARYASAAFRILAVALRAAWACNCMCVGDQSECLLDNSLSPINPLLECTSVLFNLGEFLNT